MFQDIEPHYGWLGFYSHENDPNSPFHGVEHSLFEYNRRVYTYAAHPLWDDIESESLLVKILYANYLDGYAILELFGEWNDLFENDFRLLMENCLLQLQEAGVTRFVFICENVFNIHLQSDDYYQAFLDELGDEGWMLILRPRQAVWSEIQRYGLAQYFFQHPDLDMLNWRKLKPWQLISACELVITGDRLPEPGQRLLLDN